MEPIIVSATPVPDKFWPILSPIESSRKHQVASYIAIAFIVVASLAMAFVWPEIHDLKIVPTTEDLVLGVGIYIVGFLIVFLSALSYLKVFNAIGTMIAFVITLGLILVITLPEIQAGLALKENDYHSFFAYVAYVQAGILEEAIKLAAYMLPILIFARYRSVYDVVYLAFFAGCCFALFENVMVYNQGPKAAWLRFILCTLTNATDTVIGALILAYLKTREFKAIFKWMLYPLILLAPAAFHGTYDFVLFVGAQEEGIFYLFIPVTVLAVITAWLLFRPFRRCVVAPAESQPKVIYLASV